VKLKQTRIKVEQSWLSLLAPALLWLLAFVIPVMLGRELLKNALDVEKQLLTSSAKQLLISEARKYRTSLNPDFFFQNQIDKEKLADLYEKFLRAEKTEERSSKSDQREKIVQQLKNHWLAAKLPWGSENVKNDLEPILNAFKAVLGIYPAAVYSLGPDSHSRFVIVDKALPLLLPEKEFDIVLSRAYNFWLERFNQGPGRSRFFRRFNTTPELREWLGYFLNPDTDIFGQRIRFSNKANDNLFRFSFTFQDAKKNYVNINFVFIRRYLDWKFVLKKVLSENNRGNIRHSFGYSRASTLPFFTTDDDELSFIFEVPIEFRKIYKLDEDGNKSVIRLSLPLDSYQRDFFSPAKIDFLIKLLILASLMLIIGIYSGRFSNLRKLRFVVGLSFFIGCLVPITGLAWFGLSYVRSHQHFEVKRMFDLMENRIDLVEKKMTLQKERNSVYFHILAHQISKIPAEMRHLIHSLLEEPEAKYNSDYSERIYSRPFFGYYFLNSDGTEHLFARQNFLAVISQMSPFFTGSFNEIMLAMNGYSHLEHKKRQDIVQKAQIAGGITEKAVDKRMFVEMFELEGAKIHSKLSPRKEFFTSFILNHDEKRPGGLISFFTDTDHWLKRIGKSFDLGLFPVNFIAGSYRVYLTFYPLDYINVRDLHQLRVSEDIIGNEKQNRLYKIARALFATSDRSKINNLAQKPANLVLAKVIADQDVFALAYAERKTDSFFDSRIVLVIAGLLIAFLSSLALAAGTSRVLLMSLPAFHTAIDEVQNNSFLWQMKVRSGDEFEELAASFNLMGRRLLEKEKMSQLVSENVLEVVASSDSEMLKPGGKKVEAVILFSDIRSFTTLSEKYQAETIVEMLNSYFTEMAEVISQNGGIIDKLIGDAIQAVFYRSSDLLPPEYRAAKAALTMQDRLIAFNKKRKQKGLFTVENGVGIASGTVISGRVGTETGKLDATVLGKVLHKAENLEALSRHAKFSQILIDNPTREILEKTAKRVSVQEFVAENVKSGEIFELIRLI
jgi:class 3 adenylate cyclase